MITPDTLATVAGIIAGVGAAVLPFRLDRETDMAARGSRTWLPWADRLLLTASVVSLVLVLLPVVGSIPPDPLGTRLASASCAAAVLLAAGYFPAILAHYRLLFGKHRKGPRSNPEPAERVVTWIFAVLSGLVFVIVFARG